MTCRIRCGNSTFMKRFVLVAILSMMTTAAALAEETIYHIFADGLACELCAASIDKQLRTVDGVERVDVLPDRGIVNVRMADGYVLVEKQVSRLLEDAGVNFRSMEEHPAPDGGSSAPTAPGRSEHQEKSL